VTAIVVMGVSGSGKTTLGQALASALGWPFVEGDTLHPPSNIAKMAAGIALNDEDRHPFLLAVAESIRTLRPRGVVVSCSALKRSYRDLIRARAGGDILFVLPAVDRQTLQTRLMQRQGHFMGPGLLDSQLAALEPPAYDEHSVSVDGNAPVSAQVSRIIGAMKVA
jgi:gluconokinase